MKSFKNIVLLAGILIMSVRAYSQIPAFVFDVTANQCFTYTASPNSYTLDSMMVITPPLHGALTPGSGTFIYCPQQGFTGYDTAVVFACVSNGGFLLTCDTLDIVFNVSINCAMPVTLVQDSGICAGGNRNYVAIPAGNAPYTYLWSDGSTGASACEPSPVQGVCVTVTDANGCTGNACSNVNGCNLVVTVTESPNGCGLVGPSLTATVTGGTPPYTYYWSNNATTATICNLTPGTYFLSVVDAQGCVTAATYSLSGSGGCYFTYSASNPVIPDRFSFYPASDSGYTATAWLWSFGDGSGSVLQNPIKQYNAPGNYYVTMTMYYGNGDSCSYGQYIYVPNDSINYPLCQAAFYYYMDSGQTSNYQFLDYSSYTPISWEWDFGDGTTSTLQNPTHTYNNLGTWTVCLTTTDANGCSSSTCQQISNIPVQDLQAFLYHQTSTTPGFPIWVYLGYYNAGTMLMNGTLTYRYPAGTTVNATSQTPASHDVANRLLTFNIASSVPGSSEYIYIDLTANVSLPLGTLSEDTLWVEPITGDATPADNVAVVQDTVVGSWDPNDKAVSPKGTGNQGVVPLSTNKLSYRIRFQNTGTAPARDVVIRDVINANIDLTTVKVSGASHPHTVELIGNQLVVTFANINLPDSGADYEASQGYIDVHVNLKPGLALGTQITNTAGIYFDFNEPVITNTVVNTLGEFISGVAETPVLEFAMLPNPAGNQVALRGEFNKGATFEIMNQLGQLVTGGQLTANTTAVNVSELTNGIYLVRILSGEKAAVQKLVISK